MFMLSDFIHASNVFLSYLHPHVLLQIPLFSIYIPLNPISTAQMHMGVGAWATYQWAQPQINDFPSPNSHQLPTNSSARVGALMNTDILNDVWFSSTFFYVKRTYKLEISKKPDIFKDFSCVLGLHF